MQDSPLESKPSVLKKGPFALMQLFKRFKVPEDLAVWIGAITLTTDKQAAIMALWLYESKETNPEKLLAKAKEIASANPD